MAIADRRSAALGDLPAGTEGYRTAEVTVGGVDTAGLSSKTMEARMCRDFISSARWSM